MVMKYITGVAMLIVDADLNVLQSNQNAENLFGYSAAEFASISIREVILREGVSNRQFDEVIQLINQDGSYFFTFTKAVGSHHITVESSIFLRKDDDGIIGGYVVFCQDITWQKVIQEYLEKRSKELEESNAALRALLKQRDRDKEDMYLAVQRNIDQLVSPFLSKLSRSTTCQRTRQLVLSIEAGLHEITSPFSPEMSNYFGRLTPAEIQIVNLIKKSHSSKEIAEMLNLSLGTIFTHRRNIRKKIGINNKNVNLQTMLNEF